MRPGPAELVAGFRRIRRERMRGLPFVNPALEVEAIGFRPDGPHRVGVLLTPWFMNLVLLPGDDGWDAAAPGDRLVHALPAGQLEFTVNRDEQLGTFLSAVLLSSVADFPDQRSARAVAREVVQQVFAPPAAAGGRPIGRRELLTGRRAS